MRPITVGIYLPPQFGEMKKLREAWMKAEELGADRIYVVDHFFAQVASEETMKGEPSKISLDKNFEATTIQAAMAVTTKRAEIGCIVHATGYRNPNLMADIARTIDHLSGGRFILGMGSGYQKIDYDEYGYDYGTVKSRLLHLKRDILIMKARFEKLNPKPLRKIPLMIASMGEEIGMRIVAEHADQWNVYGPLDKIAHKCSVLKARCHEIGRNPDEIEFTVSHVPALLNANPDAYVKLGVTHVIGMSRGPDWDLGPIRELIQWRDNLRAQGK